MKKIREEKEKLAREEQEKKGRDEEKKKVAELREQQRIWQPALCCLAVLTF